MESGGTSRRGERRSRRPILRCRSNASWRTLSLDAHLDRQPKSEPAVPADEKNFLAGAEVYKQHCAVCHGLPNVAPTAISEGMFPKPPQLLEGTGVTDDPAWETYWKAANGIRLTGMPGFKGRLNDFQLWQVSQLLANADKISPAVKAALAAPSRRSHATDRADPVVPTGSAGSPVPYDQVTYSALRCAPRTVLLSVLLCRRLLSPAPSSACRRSATPETATPSRASPESSRSHRAPPPAPSQTNAPSTPIQTAPSSFDAPMKTISTALTRPRISSGVAI